MGKVLILEDEDSVNRGISFSLKKAGHEICSCHTVGEAKTQAGSFQPEIVICDINLPDGSGLDYIVWLRKQSNVHIICLTALSQELDQVMGYESGADDYITKPFSLSVLLLKIEAFFRKNSREGGTMRRSGEVCIWPEQMRACVQGEEVSMTRNEWKLLCLFLDHPQQILSRQQILTHLFDMDGEFVDENTLAVNIRRLREKIEENPAKPRYIKNVRGLGYVWDAQTK